MPTSFEYQPIIERLPNFLIDQIKAGEVIERPSNVVKEIIENAIDAKASNIELHLIDNGLELIACRDNGIGINFEQLPLAFSRHATSKINRFEDLYRLKTFGFRGEALASLASISRLSCSSAPIDKEQVGGKIIIHGGEQIQYFKHEALATGTSLVIEDLFYNTPARLKFIRSKTSEKNALQKIIHSFLLANPKITFSIKWDDKEKKFYPSCSSRKARFEQLALKKKGSTDHLARTIEQQYQDYKIIGYHTLEANKNTQSKYQFLFINGRLFQDKSLHHNIIKSLQALWGPGQSGHYCFFIDAPPAAIDVNVHPTKTFIKFETKSIIHSLIHSALTKDLKSLTHDRPEQESQPEVVNTQSPAITSRLSFLKSGDRHSIGGPIKQNFSNEIQNDNSYKTTRFLFERYLIFPQKEEIQLIDCARLIDQFIEQSLKLKEASVQTLLIAEPFRREHLSAQSIKILNQGLFEFDNLDSETVLLRSVPEWMLPFRIRSFTMLIFDYLNQQGRDHDVTAYSLENLKKIDHVQLESLLQKTTLSLNQKIIKPLNPTVLESWLQI